MIFLYKRFHYVCYCSIDPRNQANTLELPCICGVRDIRAVIVTDDYLCYKELKSPYNVFLILVFNELFTFKTLDEWQH